MPSCSSCNARLFTEDSLIMRQCLTCRGTRPISSDTEDAENANYYEDSLLASRD